MAYSVYIVIFIILIYYQNSFDFINGFILVQKYFFIFSYILLNFSLYLLIDYLNLQDFILNSNNLCFIIIFFVIVHFLLIYYIGYFCLQYGIFVWNCWDEVVASIQSFICYLHLV